MSQLIFTLDSRFSAKESRVPLGGIENMGKNKNGAQKGAACKV
ncbi:hypothetical protein [uncultured Lentibacter sp.]|nr:hypothetical protein [uncultured Lentibacter sp.]